MFASASIAFLLALVIAPILGVVLAFAILRRKRFLYRALLAAALTPILFVPSCLFMIPVGDRMLSSEGTVDANHVPAVFIHKDVRPPQTAGLITYETNPMWESFVCKISEEDFVAWCAHLEMADESPRHPSTAPSETFAESGAYTQVKAAPKTAVIHLDFRSKTIAANGAHYRAAYSRDSGTMVYWGCYW